MEANGAQWVRGSIIGRGSCCSVSLAYPKKASSVLPPVMAVKSAEVSFSDTFHKEFEVLNNLQGPPYVICCLEEETTMSNNGQMMYNLLLEYASSGYFANLIDKSIGGLPEVDVRHNTRQLLKGLDHVHESGYVHCYMKPDNVLLVPSSRNCDSVPKFAAKIADCGLAKREKSKRTRYDGCLRGTAMYMAPEVVLDHVHVAPADIWALGCAVLEMLTGKSPWDSESDFAMKGLFRSIGDSGVLPQIPAWITDDAREILKGRFFRNSMFRFTTEMLMNQPFVSDVEEEEDDEDQLQKIHNCCLVLGQRILKSAEALQEKITLTDHKK